MLQIKNSPKDKSSETAKLRDQIRRELIAATKLCSYEKFACNHPRYENFNYCFEHILNDPNAEFKQCNYVYELNGKRCHMPASKVENKFGFCMDHMKKTVSLKNKAKQKSEPNESVETILTSLAHYVKSPSSTNTNQFDEKNNSKFRIKEEDELISPGKDEDNLVTKSLDPFLDIDAKKVNNACSEILDYASDSDSDIDVTTYNEVWHSHNIHQSDNESIDSETEDLLKHADVYTEEEVCTITKDKLIQLQKLYSEQFRYLQLELREKRRNYLYALKKERETLSTIHNQIRDNPQEYKIYQKLKALNGYSRRTGVEAILQKRVNDIRNKMNESGQYKAPPYIKCAYTEGGVKCAKRVLPLARHCLKHILNDTQQVLFRACGITKGDADFKCHEPVPDIFQNEACVYHAEFPEVKSYTYMKKDEDTDMEDSTDTVEPGNLTEIKTLNDETIQTEA